MYLFNADLKNQLTKLRSRKKYLVLLIIELIICAVWGLVNLALGKAVLNIGLDAKLVLGSMPMSLLGFFIQVYIPLIIFMAACDLFAGELADKTVRAGFMRPVSRFKQYLSRVAAVMILACVYLLVLFVISAAYNIIYGHTASGLLSAFVAYLLDAVPLLILILFAVLINQIAGGTSLSILLCILLYLGFYVIGVLVPQSSGMFFTGYAQWHNLWIGTWLPLRAILPKLGILIGYGAVFGSLGYYLYERRAL